MISKVLYSLFFGITMMEAIGTSLTLTEKIDPHSYITPILKNNAIDHAYKVITYIQKKQLSLQAQIYHEIITWCLQNKKVNLAIAIVKAMPSRTFIQGVSRSISLGQLLLKDAIILQIAPLLSEIIRKIPLYNIKKYLISRDANSNSLHDYAEQTGNQEIIELIDLKKIQHLQTSRGTPFFIRAIGCALMLLIVIPVILYITFGILLAMQFRGNPMAAASAADTLIFGLPILFPATILISIIAFGNITLHKFGFKTMFTNPEQSLDTTYDITLPFLGGSIITLALYTHFFGWISAAYGPYGLGYILKNM